MQISSPPDVRPRTPCCSKYALVSHCKDAAKIGPETALLVSMVTLSHGRPSPAGAVRASVPCSHSDGHLGLISPHCSPPRIYKPKAPTRLARHRKHVAVPLGPVRAWTGCDHGCLPHLDEERC